jgi:alpha-mannosidase
MYSTPSIYTSAKQRASKRTGLRWEVRQDDIFPLADNDHAYWSGYFTSRPALKRQVRVNSNLLNAARQLEVITRTTAAEVDTPTGECSGRPVSAESQTGRRWAGG